MIVTQLGTEADIAGVLMLQQKYLSANLSEHEKVSGFVTTPFTKDQINSIIDQDGLFVAKEESNIVAYLFAANWQYFSQWEIFKFMIGRFPELSFNNKTITIENSFQYGPVCIEKAYRGVGLFNLLFEEMRLVFVNRFPISITFINQVNVISTAAHTRKLGWKVIDEFEFNNNQYLGLAFDMTCTGI